MIALAILAALAVLWGCIATAVAVLRDGEKKVLTNALIAEAVTIVKRDERITDLENRLQAKSLGEYAGAHVAMQAPEPEPQGYYRYDETGMIREWVPAGSENDDE